MVSLPHESYLKYEEAQKLHYEWLANSSSMSHHQVEAVYQSSLIGMSRFLSQVLATYNMPSLLFSTAILIQVVFMLGLQLVGAPVPFSTSDSSNLMLCVASTLVVSIVISLIGWLPIILSLPCLMVLLFNFILLGNQCRSSSLIYKNLLSQLNISWQTLLPLGTVMFCISLFSSSLIEEEHQLWYFLWTTVIVSRMTVSHARWLAVLMAHRFLRTLNQTGDKWAHMPDFSDWLNHNRPLLTAFCIISMVVTCWCCAKVHSRWFSNLLYICTTITIMLYKAAAQQLISFTSLLPFNPSVFTASNLSGVMEARVCWLLLLLLAVLLGRSLDCLLAVWMLLSCLLLRPYNTLLVPALFLTSKTVVNAKSPSTVSNTILHHWMGAVFFFYQGNSNSLASVDLAAGYIGLEEYNFVIVAILLLCHTYSMPVLAYLLNIDSIIKHSRRGDWRKDVACSAQVVGFLQLLHASVCLIVITVQRYHLFVWTVFSPKLLYVAAQTFTYFVLVSITNICVFYLLPRVRKKSDEYL